MNEEDDSSHNSRKLSTEQFSPQKITEHILRFGPINHLFIQKYEDGPIAAVQFCRWCREVVEGDFPALDDYLENIACKIQGNPEEFDKTYKETFRTSTVKYAKYIIRFFDIMCTIDKYMNRGEQPDINVVNTPVLSATASDKIDNKELLMLAYRNGIRRHETVHRQLEARLVNIIFYLEEQYYPGFEPPFVFSEFEIKQEVDLLKMIMKGKVDEAIKLGKKQEFIVSLLVLQALQKQDHSFLNALDGKKTDNHVGTYIANYEKVHRPKKIPKEPERTRPRAKPKKVPKPIDEIGKDNPERLLTAEEVDEYMPLFCATSLTIISMGRVCHKPGYCNGKYLYNPGFRSERLYFDVDSPEDRCIYISSIHESSDGPLFRVQKKGTKHIYEGTAPSSSWLDVIKDIEEVKKAHNMVLRGSLTVSGPEFFGLSNPTVLRIMRRMAPLQDIEKPIQARKVRKVRSLRERQTDVRSTEKKIELPSEDESDSSDPEPLMTRQRIAIMRRQIPLIPPAPKLLIKFPQEAFMCEEAVDTFYEIKGDPLSFAQKIEKMSNEMKN